MVMLRVTFTLHVNQEQVRLWNMHENAVIKGLTEHKELRVIFFLFFCFMMYASPGQHRHSAQTPEEKTF